MSFLDRFFGPTYAKELRHVEPIVQEINALESSYSNVSNEEIRQMSEALFGEVSEGASLDAVLPRAYALVRESSRRTLGQRHYDVQLIGGIILHRGRITEMRTGEGKTLVGTLPAYLNALTNKGVHIITVNDYLARRDAVWMGQIYAFLGLRVGVINQQASYLYDPLHAEKDAERDADGSFKIAYDFLRPCSRKEAYEAHITYGTNSEFGFDYLRDNIEFDAISLRQRGHTFAIIDEVDSILIDEARTPLIISGPSSDSGSLYAEFSKIASKLEPEVDYVIDEKLKSATLTDHGIEAAESILGVQNIYTDKGITYVHHLETAVRAKALFVKDREYVVRDNEVVIVDEFTGRLQPGRRWSDGLHQAIEAKEGVTVQRESQTYASITYQNYFRMYEKLCGMTGTGLTSQEEFYSVYRLDVIPVPTHKPIARVDHNDLIFQTEKGKTQAIIRKVKEVHEKGQPILIGTASIEKNEALSIALTRAGVVHEMLNAKNHEREGEIIAEAGKKGRITLATNMAGRGVDIKLGGVHATTEEYNQVRELGGLFVLGTERHEARRIDNQLRGRSGRQGDPGETQFYVSMDDSLMRVFASVMVKNMMGKFGIPEDQPIENSMITRSLESAQKKIEGFNFDARKHVLAYDDVLNQQRQIIYVRRNNLLKGDVSEIEKLQATLIERNPELLPVLAQKEMSYGKEAWGALMRRVLLQAIDGLWVEHLEVMQHTRSSVGLRAYGQQDPLIEYRKEGVRLFKEMEEVFYARVSDILPHVEEAALVREERAHKSLISKLSLESGDIKEASLTPQKPIHNTVTIGRNDLVTITDGKNVETLKYKKAEEKIRNGWTIVEPTSN